MIYGIFYDVGSSISWGYEWLDGDIEKVELISPGFDGGMTYHPLYDGRPVKSDHIASKLRASSSRKTFPTFAKDNGFIVSELFRTAVNKLEPDVHQFFPVEVVSKAGEIRVQMYLFIVGNRLDSLHRNRTEWLWVPLDKKVKGGGYWTKRYSLKTTSLPTDHWQIPEGAKLDDPEWYKREKLVFDKAKVEGCHVWIERHISNSGPFISQELFDALTSAGAVDLGFTEFDQVRCIKSKIVGCIER